MDKRSILTIIALAGLLLASITARPVAAADQPVNTGFQAPDNRLSNDTGSQNGDNDEDPFAGLMDEQPIEVIKTGPTCQFIRIQLPPGVTFEDIQGLPTP